MPPCLYPDRVFFMPGGGSAVELKFKAKIMDEAAIDRTLVRIAHEILSLIHI